MPVPPLPPLRVREVDGAPNVIPVLEIVVSNNTLQDLGGGSVSIGVPSGGSGASTANSYVTWQAEAALSAEKVLTAGSSVVIHTDATAIYIDALTGGAAAVVYAATGNSYVLVANAADLTADRALTAGLGITIADSGANGNIYVQAATPFLVSSNRAINTTAPVAGGGNLSLDRTITVDTAVLVTSGRLLTAGSGLGGGGDLSADRTFSVNTNVRDKITGFFAAGTLTTAMQATSCRIYIPFNMELRDVRLACVTTPVGANIIVQVYNFPSPTAAGSAFFTAANRPIIATGGAIGSAGTFANTVAFVGSYLGYSIDQVGTTSTGDNLTVTVIARTS